MTHLFLLVNSGLAQEISLIHLCGKEFLFPPQIQILQIEQSIAHTPFYFFRGPCRLFFRLHRRDGMGYTCLGTGRSNCLCNIARRETRTTTAE